MVVETTEDNLVNISSSQCPMTAKYQERIINLTTTPKAAIKNAGADLHTSTLSEQFKIQQQLTDVQKMRPYKL